MPARLNLNGNHSERVRNIALRGSAWNRCFVENFYILLPDFLIEGENIGTFVSHFIHARILSIDAVCERSRRCAIIMFIHSLQVNSKQTSKGFLLICHDQRRYNGLACSVSGSVLLDLGDNLLLKISLFRKRVVIAAVVFRQPRFTLPSIRLPPRCGVGNVKDNDENMCVNDIANLIYRSTWLL